MSTPHPHARALRRPAARGAAAHDLLGADHPLARTQSRIHALLGQSAGVSTLAALSGLAWSVAPDRGYMFLFAAASLVQALLALALLTALDARRDTIVQLIAQGRADLPLAAVTRRRRRLLRAKRRLRMARSIDDLRREAAGPLRAQLPLYSRGVVRSVDQELANVARLLRAQHVSPERMAQALLLVSGSSSPLYGSDAEQLRRELGRLAFALGSAVTAAPR